MVLPKLTSKDLVFQNKYGHDRLYSKLILDDRDWMNYILKAAFHTTYGRFILSFEYFGAKFSTLKVSLKKGDHTNTYEFEFSTDLFAKYITRYLKDQIRAWETSAVFYAEELVLNFYNEVISSL